MERHSDKKTETQRGGDKERHRDAERERKTEKRKDRVTGKQRVWEMGKWGDERDRKRERKRERVIGLMVERHRLFKIETLIYRASERQKYR